MLNRRGFISLLGKFAAVLPFVPKVVATEKHAQPVSNTFVPPPPHLYSANREVIEVMAGMPLAAGDFVTVWTDGKVRKCGRRSKKLVIGRAMKSCGKDETTLLAMRRF